MGGWMMNGLWKCGGSKSLFKDCLQKYTEIKNTSIKCNEAKVIWSWNLQLERFERWSFLLGHYPHIKHRPLNQLGLKFWNLIAIKSALNQQLWSNFVVGIPFLVTKSIKRGFKLKCQNWPFQLDCTSKWMKQIKKRSI